MLVVNYKTNFMSQSNEHSRSELFTNICDIKGKHHVGKLFDHAHLSKGTSGLKEKCTQTPTSFLDTVFHAHSHGVIHFVPRVSSKNLEMEVSDWLCLST